MNEDTYNIASATSSSGENLIIPIKWDFESVNDLKVVAVANGNAEILNSGYSWNDTLKQLEVQNNYGYEEWSVYVMREEDAQNVLQLISTSEVNAQNIVEQFNRTNRVVQQIQVNQRASICVPDKVNGLLPDVDARKGKFISFDDNGNPVANIEVETLAENRQKAEEAQAGAETAQANAENYAERASEFALSSSYYATVSHAWAVGDVDYKDTINNNAKHYAGLANAFASTACGYSEEAYGYLTEAKGIVEEFQEAFASVEAELTQHKYNLDDAIDEHFRDVESNFAENVSAEIERYNDNAFDEKNNFNDNVIFQRGIFDKNCEDKTYAFNLNASSKEKQFNTNADDVLLQAKGYATEAKNARDEAVEIVDPEGWRTGTRAMIDSLAVAKANRGEFWFNGGFLQNDTLKYSQGNPFSFAFGFRAKKSDILGITTSIYIVNLGFLYLYLPNDKKKIAFYSGGVFSDKYISDADNDRLLNGEWHSLIISYDGITLKLTDETGVLLSVSATLPSQSSSIEIGSYLIGQMRSIKYFNFDMSDVNAPYTIADYISGKDESPFLQGSQIDFNWANSKNPTLESIGVTVGDNGVVLTNESEVHIFPFAVGAFKKGYTYRIKTSGSLVSSQSMRLTCPMSKFKLIRKNIATGVIEDASSNPNKVISTAYLFSADGNYWETELEFTATKDSIRDNNHLRISAVDTSATNSFTMSAEKIGALLSLEDVKSGVQVLDKSGNGNHANISGLVYASKENNPARCVDSASFSWAGTATTQKFANSDVAIPANSKVVAYAKSSVGMSASFTCGSNSAVSKELSANTLTEIGSFLNASQGAFKVAPSSATTGKMDVYLTIEKF